MVYWAFLHIYWCSYGILSILTYLLVLLWCTEHSDTFIGALMLYWAFWHIYWCSYVVLSILTHSLVLLWFTECSTDSVTLLREIILISSLGWSLYEHSGRPIRLLTYVILSVLLDFVTLWWHTPHSGRFRCTLTVFWAFWHTDSVGLWQYR
jgi:hypothetical protein